MKVTDAPGQCSPVANGLQTARGLRFLAATHACVFELFRQPGAQSGIRLKDYPQFGAVAVDFHRLASHIQQAVEAATCRYGAFQFPFSGGALGASVRSREETSRVCAVWAQRAGEETAMELERFRFAASSPSARQKARTRVTTTRHSSTTVTFRRPFVLNGFEQLQPAGSYTLDIEEELLDTLLSPVWKRTSTVMRLRRQGAIEQVSIDPEQMKEALVRDAAQPEPSKPLASSPPEARRYRAYSLLGRLPHRVRR